MIFKLMNVKNAPSTPPSIPSSTAGTNTAMLIDSALSTYGKAVCVHTLLSADHGVMQGRQRPN